MLENIALFDLMMLCTVSRTSLQTSLWDYFVYRWLNYKYVLNSCHPLGVTLSLNPHLLTSSRLFPWCLWNCIPSVKTVCRPVMGMTNAEMQARKEAVKTQNQLPRESKNNRHTKTLPVQWNSLPHRTLELAPSSPSPSAQICTTICLSLWILVFSRIKANGVWRDTCLAVT